MRNKEKTYISVSIPKSLIKEIDRLIGQQGYTSRAEVIKEAVRRYLDEKKTAQQTPNERNALAERARR